MRGRKETIKIDRQDCLYSEYKREYLNSQYEYYGFNRLFGVWEDISIEDYVKIAQSHNRKGNWIPKDHILEPEEQEFAVKRDAARARIEKLREEYMRDFCHACGEHHGDGYGACSAGWNFNNKTHCKC